MHDTLETFVEDLRRSKFAPVADQLEAVLRATDLEADWNPHAAVLVEAVSWVVGHTDRSLVERIEALHKLIRHDGSEIELHAFTGWME